MYLLKAYLSNLEIFMLSEISQLLNCFQHTYSSRSFLHKIQNYRLLKTKLDPKRVKRAGTTRDSKVY
jgi:hypothetical protein